MSIASNMFSNLALIDQEYDKIQSEALPYLLKLERQWVVLEKKLAEFKDVNVVSYLVYIDMLEQKQDLEYAYQMILTTIGEDTENVPE